MNVYSIFYIFSSANRKKKQTQNACIQACMHTYNVNNCLFYLILNNIYLHI